MQFRRSGQRDDRRRRVLMDDSAEAAGPGPKRARRKSPRSGLLKHSYSDEARWDRQLRVVDLLPKRGWVFGVLLLSVALVLAGLSTLHAQLPQWSAAIAPGDLAALDLASPANLAVWFSSALLLLAALASLQVYTLRRHKIDDYRGRYRVWLWAAAVLLVASMDATARFHLLFRGLLVHLTGQSLPGDRTVWWSMLYVVLLGGFALRMLIEIRRSWAAVIALLMAAASYGAALALKTSLLAVADPAAAVMIQMTATLSGHGLVLFSVWFYGRHVYFDAQGRPSARGARRGSKTSLRQARSAADGRASGGRTKSARSGAAEAAAAAVNQRLDRDALAQMEDQLQQNGRSRKQRKGKKTKSSSIKLLRLDDDRAQHPPRRLNKAERKLLRKQRRGRRAA